MNRKRVLVLARMPAPAMAVFEDRPDVDVHVESDWSQAKIRSLVPDIDGVILGVQPFGEDMIAASPRLAVASRFGVGYDAVDVEALTRRKIPLTVVGIANAVTVAEHSMFMMLALAKRAFLYDRETRRGNWGIRFDPQANDLYRKTVLIAGFGRIGTRLAARCRAFEMEVLVADPFVDPAAIRAAGCEPVEFRAALPRADFVSLNCPKGPETTGMVGAAELAAMKPTAYLVNTARGGLIDEAALFDALSNRTIQGAGIDVFDTEPATADEPLFKLDNIIVSPHSAGVTYEATVRMGIAAAKNVLDAFDGTLDADNVINREVL